MKLNSLAVTRSPGRAAFTLVELLVVMAIVAILSSLILPALASSRVKARQINCCSNMRQIGLAMQMYADDYRGFFPETTHGISDTNRSWIFSLRPYLSNVDQVRICPADARGRERLTNNSSSYILNEYIAVDRLDPFGSVIESFRNLNNLQRPCETHTVFITANDTSPSVFSDHTHSRNWGKGWGAVTKDIEPDRHRAGKATATRSSGSANYLFADGHVASIAAAKLKARVDRGENFARPLE